MSYSIEEIPTDEPISEALVQFLNEFENDNRGVDIWRNRLKYWWIENPMAKAIPLRGWLLRYQESIVGFMGLIGGEYVYKGVVYPAAVTTTWRVATHHRNASLPMFLKLNPLRKQFLILDTTPREEVVKLMQRSKYQSETQLHRLFFPIRQTGLSVRSFLLNLNRWITRPSNLNNKLKIVGLNDPFQVPQRDYPSDRVEKHITPEYLRWLCRSPTTELDFVGQVNDAGNLVAYVIFKREMYKGLPGSSIVDYFSIHQDPEEVLNLIQAISSRPEVSKLLRDSNWLVLNTFEAIFTARKPFAVLHRQGTVPHYFSLPTPLKDCSKRCVIAEGDCVL